MSIRHNSCEARGSDAHPEAFGNGGIVNTDVTGMLMNDAAYAFAVDEVGRVLAVGDTTLDAKQPFALARYLVPDPRVLCCRWRNSQQ